MSLDFQFSITKPYRLISKGEIETAFSHRRSNVVADGWEGFGTAFPDSSGYLILSGVGFNADRTVALVYVEHLCGGLCAEERFYILKKLNGQWFRFLPKGLKSEMTGVS
ncbi:MAG TPA: hypothetical protein VEK33_18750 [Terriglobales bacterium]|nr:hypothetical protein [Terriglobales bacterium]